MSDERRGHRVGQEGAEDDINRIEVLSAYGRPLATNRTVKVRAVQPGAVSRLRLFRSHECTHISTILDKMVEKLPRTKNVTTQPKSVHGPETGEPSHL